MRAPLLALILMLFIVPASAQRLISTLSSQEISIDSNFTGESLTLFGNIEPEIGEATIAVTGPFDIVIAIHGPNTQRVVRRKARQFGIWLNSEGVGFDNVPSFYHVLSSQPLSQIMSPENLLGERIGLEHQVPSMAEADPNLVPRFSAELIRLMQESDMFGVNERHVSFLSPSFYKAHLELPADVPNGTYLAKTYLVQDGEIIDQRAERFVVRTAGVERLLSSSAQHNPLWYGLACVVLALMTGWIASVAFRR